MNYYLTVLKKYAVFSGRARRAEYWYFALFNIIIVFGLAFVEGLLEIASDTDESIFAWIYQLAVFIPNLAVGVRRMHDVDKSGWFLFIPIYSVILTIMDGTKGDNKYGPDPKKVEAESKEKNIYCSRCGNKLDIDSEFCAKCGTKILNK
jgi:uncharacterized membrane protein YhaH (DUF805 family)